MIVVDTDAGEVPVDFAPDRFSDAVAAAGTPPELLALLADKTAALLATAAFRQRFQNLGVQIKGGTAQEFAAWIAVERARWTKVVREAGAKPN